ncbi:bZIP transcription factor [Aspergillus lucknowensis]|uniref:BZIP domain-containing protein n=1 Tax=Aspergillus lucknowensis TaxID=176173 RepID=A0ABR4LLX0_9EURO
MAHPARGNENHEELLWPSASNFAMLQWPDAASPSPDHSSSDERYHLPEDVLDFPDLRLSLAENPSSPQSSASDYNTDKSKRRREQNRNAQRAYRERKEKYIKNLLKLIDEMNRNHVRLSESYEAVRLEALRLQDQVLDLRAQLEFWRKAQVLVVKYPEDAAAAPAATGVTGVTGGGPGVGVSMGMDSGGLLAGSGGQGLGQSIDPLLESDLAYPVL